jgi:hypothetical protein
MFSLFAILGTNQDNSMENAALASRPFLFPFVKPRFPENPQKKK